MKTVSYFKRTKYVKRTKQTARSLLSARILFYHKAHEARRKVTNQALSYYVYGLNYERPLKFIKKMTLFKKWIAQPLIQDKMFVQFLKKVLDQF